MPPQSVGKPSKLTPRTKDTLFKALQSGNFLDTACACAGVSYSTVRQWIQRGEGTHPTRKPTKEYVEFAEEIRYHIAAGEVRCVQEIRSEGAKGARWILPRRHPERWSSVRALQREVEKQLDKEREKEVRDMEKLMPEGSYHDYLTALAARGKLPAADDEQE